MNCISLVCLQCKYCFQETTCSLPVNMFQGVAGEGGVKYWNVTCTNKVTAP